MSEPKSQIVKINEICKEILEAEKNLQVLTEKFNKIKKDLAELGYGKITIKCPHLSQFPDLSCVYLLDSNNCCEDIDICPGNSDAWCTSNLEKVLSEED